MESGEQELTFDRALASNENGQHSFELPEFTKSPNLGPGSPRRNRKLRLAQAQKEINPLQAMRSLACRYRDPEPFK